MDFMEFDRKRAEDAQVEKLHRQMVDIQDTMIEQSMLRKKLENLMDAESSRSEMALERVSSRNVALQDELDKRFGSDHRSASRSPAGRTSSNNNKVLDQVMSLRTKEFQKSQAHKASNIHHLAQERQRILEARNRLQEKKERLRVLPSPVGSDISEIEMRTPTMRPTPSYRSVHSSDSHVKRAVNNMPQTVDRIWSIRESMVQDYEKMRKPYNGELGIGSYEKWQLPDYFMVLGLVKEFVDDFLVKHTPPDEVMFEREMRLHLEGQRMHSMDLSAGLASESRNTTLVAEEILLQMTSHMVREIAMEVHMTHNIYTRLSNNAFIKQAEIQATGNPEGRDPHDDSYDLLTRAFQTLQKERDRNKKGVWAHSQMMNHPAAPPVKPLRRDMGPTPPQPPPPKGKPKPPPPKKDTGQPPPDEEPLDPDIMLIRHNHLHPEHLRLTQTSKMDDKEEKQRKFWRGVYRKREVHYWTNLRPFMFNVGISKRGQGVEVVVPSPDHMMVAVGMKSGDVLVLNTLVEPWSIVKMDIGQSPVVHLAWNLDSSGLMAVRKSGIVTVWNVNGVPASKQALKAMGVPSEDGRNQPFALAPVVSLDPKKGNFTLASGPLVDEGNAPDKPTPVIANFYPTLTYLSSQSTVCVGLQSGEVFKLDALGMESDTNRSRNILLKPSIPAGEEQEENVTKGDNLVQMLRQHKYPVITLGCIDNLGKLVTVDSKGFINIWKYDNEHVTQFGWYFPENKYKLDFNKIMYSPSHGDRVKVIFTDRNRSKTTSQVAIARERREAQVTLNNIQLGYPWHVSMDRPGLETSIYIPPGGSMESGAMFNIIIRHTRTQQLSTYMTRYYTPVKVGSSKLLSAHLSPSAKQMVFVLLFPAFPPKDAHLMVLVLELPSVKLRKFRYDHPVTDQQHNELAADKMVCSAQMSQVYGPTGADYLFLTVGGDFTCVSLATGCGVLRIDNPAKPKVSNCRGLVIDKKQFPLSSIQKVCFVGNMGSLYAVFYDQNTTGLKILRLEDGNDHEDSVMVWKAFEQWERFHATPIELRINPVDWALPDMKHKMAEMRSLILGLPFGAAPPSEDQRTEEKTNNYNVLQDEVTAEGLLINL